MYSWQEKLAQMNFMWTGRYDENLYDIGFDPYAMEHYIELKKRKIILFDWDNTLVDTFDCIWRAQNDMRVHYGLKAKLSWR